MGAGGPASELIMFIVAVLVAGSVAGALAYVTNDIAQGIHIKGSMLSNELRTNFAIINDPNNIPVNTSTTPYTYTFYIKNIGQVSIPFNSNSVQVLIDGLLVPSANLTFEPSTYISPYQVGEIKIKYALNPGYHTITVVLENGIKRSLVFKI
ncbi:flagellar protein G [Thermococcus henrietii]|uniref:flagellar protein G n=1 Tax=Thermococcus henrietii TaxID=2016361 RepID=UPI000C079324|nr:flagellar protein G [Thermococcus henrietii]